MNSSESAENRANLSFQLNPEVIEKLNALHAKGIDVNETILKMLEKRDEEIAGKKEEIAKETAEREEQRRKENKEPSRYVGTKTKQILKEEFGTKCCVGVCDKEAAQLHHTVPFVLGKTNDPNLLKPLCREHHDILHTVNSNYVRRKCGYGAVGEQAIDTFKFLLQDRAGGFILTLLLHIIVVVSCCCARHEVYNQIN